MRNKRCRSGQNKEVDEGSDSKDFITELSDDIVVMILCLLPIKYAVVTGSVCKKWRFLWRNLRKLNFDGTGDLIITRDWRLLNRKRQMYVYQVNDVIGSYNHPMVEEFRIRFDLDNDHRTLIDGWLKFAVKKKVETIELYFVDVRHRSFLTFYNYDFPLSLSNRNDAVVEIPSLQKLYLKNVNVTEEILEQFLTNSPHLETISIHGSGYLTKIRVSGRPLNIKHFEIDECPMMSSIHLSDFDLVSFVYKGQPINLNLANLPNLHKLICQGIVTSRNNIYKLLSSCALSLEVLSFVEHPSQRFLELDSLPILPNVRELTLTIGAHEDESLLQLTSIFKACPSLESLTVKLIWFTPVRRRGKVMHFATYLHEHLKLFQILGYYGRGSDLELAAYVMENAVGLQKIVIDPRYQAWYPSVSEKDFSKKVECARSFAKMQLIPRSPAGVNLVIL
ncbi:putative F-box domain, FBD domain, leucine-rich repeat domain superfamily [Helianthus annuus]|nr:putative F-box domain, FBD domain, leucine-rich repeat domain superfamily [Helianthus annuus]